MSLVVDARIRNTFNGRVPQAGPKMPKVLGEWNVASSEELGYCPVGTCTTQVPLRLLICRDDIGKVPAELLEAYFATYQRGQNALTASAENRAAYAAIATHCALLLAEGAAS